MARQEEASIAVVSHGLALALYLRGILDLCGDAAFELWSQTRFPDAAVLDPVSRRLERRFGPA